MEHIRIAPRLGRIEEIVATREVLEAKEFFISDEQADRILDMEIEQEQGVLVTGERFCIYETSDGELDLRAVLKKVKTGAIKGFQASLVLKLLTEETFAQLIVDGERIWINADKIDPIFGLPLANQSKGYSAWYLSQPPGARYYCGEWFERRGKFLVSKKGEYILSPNGLPKFRADSYRITQTAEKVYLGETNEE